MSHAFIAPATVVHPPARGIRTAAERARVVWPWAATFALATTLVLAVDHSIAGAQVAPMQAEPADALTTLPAPSTHTILLTSTDAEGVTQSVVCDAPPNLFASDVLELYPADLTRLSTNSSAVTPDTESLLQEPGPALRVLIEPPMHRPHVDKSNASVSASYC